MKKRDHWDTGAWLRHMKFISKLKTPEQRQSAEDFPGITCYKDLFSGHFWIQVYNEDGSLWLLHGKDSSLPGLDVKHASTGNLEICDCGRWMPASKEQTERSRNLASSVERQIVRGRN